MKPGQVEQQSPSDSPSLGCGAPEQRLERGVTLQKTYHLRVRQPGPSSKFMLGGPQARNAFYYKPTLRLGQVQSVQSGDPGILWRLHKERREEGKPLPPLEVREVSGDACHKGTEPSEGPAAALPCPDPRKEYVPGTKLPHSSGGRPGELLVE